MKMFFVMMFLAVATVLPQASEANTGSPGRVRVVIGDDRDQWGDRTCIRYSDGSVRCRGDRGGRRDDWRGGRGDWRDGRDGRDGRGGRGDWRGGRGGRGDGGGRGCVEIRGRVRCN